MVNARDFGRFPSRMQDSAPRVEYLFFLALLAMAGNLASRDIPLNTTTPLGQDLATVFHIVAWRLLLEEVSEV